MFKVVKLTPLTFDLEGSQACVYDKLIVYDDEGPLTPPLCGQGPECLGNHPDKQIVSRGLQMVVEFVSDESINAAGFTIAYQVEGGLHQLLHLSFMK